MDEKQYPPVMKLFKGTLDKGGMTPQKVIDFRRWIEGPKCSEEMKEEANALLSKAEQFVARNPQQVRSTKAEIPQPGRKGNVQDKTNNAQAASPEIIGSPFHNPYTFIPYPARGPERHTPTPLTIDEIEKDRLSGVIRVAVKTLSPLMTCQPENNKDQKRSKYHKIMHIGNDVIVPASSIRGALRNMMSIISGGTLSYLDDNLWLCQGRDVMLGGMKAGGVQDKLYLAKVIQPGNSFHDGSVVFGEARLVDYVRLKNLVGFDFNKYEEDYAKQDMELWIDDPAELRKWAKTETSSCHWLVKISGRKVNSKGRQHEGAFRPSCGKAMTLRSTLWADYQGRNRNSDVGELKAGGIIWLESNLDDGMIQSADDVRSIQWARWGRRGKKLTKVIRQEFLPDSINTDGKVDMVSDLFGSVSMNESYPAFAARVVPGNLVFPNAVTRIIENNPMPPLSSPHPGCVAFYLDNDNYDQISINDIPRGYKVYRTTSETGSSAPWNYNVQPIYNQSKPKPFGEAGEMIFSADLLNAGVTGEFDLSFRALNKQELSLLLLTLSCDFRFGGGKPLGLGHCVAEKIKIIGEDGQILADYNVEKAKIPEHYVVPANCLTRADMYCKTQMPVEKLRYPRMINANGDCGGMLWFAKFAALKKAQKGESCAKGLQSIWLGEDFKTSAGADQIRAQALPKFDPTNPLQDKLYGYDVQPVELKESKPKRIIGFRDRKDATVNPDAHRDKNWSQNRESRQDVRNRR